MSSTNFTNGFEVLDTLYVESLVLKNSNSQFSCFVIINPYSNMDILIHHCNTLSLSYQCHSDLIDGNAKKHRKRFRTNLFFFSASHREAS